MPDGRVLVAGGANGPEGSLGSTEIFDPATSTFSDGPPMVSRRMAHTATLLADGRVVLVGGWSDSFTPAQSSNTAEVFDPEAMAFAKLPDLSAARHDHVAPVTGTCGLVVVGGIQVIAGVTATPLSIERLELGKD